MTALATSLDATTSDFVAESVADAEYAFRNFRATGTITGNGTVAFSERIPGRDAYVQLNDPGPWATDATVVPTVIDFDGAVVSGPGRGGFGFEKLFTAHPDITTAVHVHSPHLGAWSQTHRVLPIHYVPVQRWTLAREIPVYIDRRESQVDFILARLAENRHTPAILEANGGATVWGRKGLLGTAEYIQLLEEGAKFQILAEALGGSQPFGPGVLLQQWRMSGLEDQARSEGLLD
jgi:ribulose-5-phosphate 4-epimerase/fuculose-1-phosphate aldolase